MSDKDQEIIVAHLVEEDMMDGTTAIRFFESEEAAERYAKEFSESSTWWGHHTKQFTIEGGVLKPVSGFNS